eukprot:285950-Pelagomonas_calceolata.AAC.1
MMKLCSGSRACATQCTLFLQTTDPVATFMLLTHWRGLSCNVYLTWLNHYRLAKVFAKLPAGNIQFQTPQHWFDSIPNPTLPSYSMQLIVVWNLNDKEALDSANKDRFQLLNQDVPE